jgi:PhnB protein
MPIKSLSPYLNFNGNAGQAIKHYESALGAKADNIMRFGEMAGPDAPQEIKDRVMHCVLRIGPGVLMISDGRPGTQVPPGGNSHVNLDFDNLDEMGKAFQALSAGGEVTMPLADMFWGARWGTLTDAYGIQWMFNCEKK